MRKLLLTLVLIVPICIGLSAGLDAVAGTFIYELKRDGQVVGRWGVEIRPRGNKALYRSHADFSPSVGSVMIIRNFGGSKQVTISSHELQQMVEMKLSSLRWLVGTERGEVSIKRFENAELVDEVKISPVLPVYDFTSYVFSLAQKAATFDFYLLEPGHEKRMRSERLNQKTWLLKFEDTPVLRVRLNGDGVPETIDLGVCPAYDLRGYSLDLSCQREGGLEQIRSFTPGDVLEAYLNSTSWGKRSAKRCTNRFVRRKGAFGLLVPCCDCIYINRDVTAQIKRAVIEKMTSVRAILENFRSNFVSVDYDMASRTFFPVFNSAQLKNRRTYDLSKIYRKISRRYANVEFGRPLVREGRIVVPYYYTYCAGTEYEDTIDLGEEFSRAYPGEPLPDFFEASGTQSEITITGFRNEKMLFLTKKVPVGELAFSATQFEENFLARYPESVGQLDKTWLDPSSVRSLGILKVKYRLCRYEKRANQEVVDLAAKFSRVCGIGPEYLVCSEISSDIDSVTVEFQPSRRLGLLESFALKRLISISMPTLANPNLYLSEERGRIVLKGTSGLYLDQPRILKLLRVPQGAIITVTEEGLKAKYFDLECY